MASTPGPEFSPQHHRVGVGMRKRAEEWEGKGRPGYSSVGGVIEFRERRWGGRRVLLSMPEALGPPSAQPKSGVVTHTY